MNALTHLPTTPLPERISDLYAHINAATFDLLELIREFDQAGLYASLNCKSTAHWLNYACGIALGPGREKVRVARALVDLPLIRDAFRAGRLSYSKARALTRAATAEDESTLLNVAFHSTASQTERIVKTYRQTVNRHTDGQVALLERSVTWYWNERGELVLKGTLTADQGVLLLKALDQLMAPPDMGKDAEPGQTVTVRRADALVRIAERSLAASAASSSTVSTASVADHYQVCVHLDARLAPHIEGGPVVGDDLARRLSCDASVSAVLEDQRGNPIKIGRKTRVVSSHLKRALKHRDKGCRFPGCEQIHHVDAHHIHHWANGGATTLDNLVLLCRRHHTFVHEGGYRIHKRGEVIHFTDRTGQHISPTGDDLTGGNVTALVKHVPAGTSLDPQGLRPELDFRPIDYDFVNQVLTQHLFRPPRSPDSFR